MKTFESQIDQHRKLEAHDPELFAVLMEVYLKHNEEVGK